MTTKCFTWSQNEAKMAPDLVPGASKMVPWSPLGGLWRPGGALGSQSQIFEGFGGPSGVPFWAPKSFKIWSKLKAKSSIAFYHSFLGSGGLQGHILETFLRHFEVLFGCPTAPWTKSRKQKQKSDDVTALSKFFQVPGSRKL